MSTTPTDFDQFEENHKVPSGKKVAYDPRVSLNTIVICITAAASAYGLIDKISANAAATATIQATTISNTSAIDAIRSQRILDRQELLLELRDIKTAISNSSSNSNSKK